MTQAETTITTIRRPTDTANPHNPLTDAVHSAGRKLCALQMTRLVRDLLDIAKIVDDALLAIGREARVHFGSDVDLTLFADQLRGALEGNATHTICAAVEAREEEIEAEIGDWRYKHHREADAA